jgi:hypothetical protein
LKKTLQPKDVPLFNSSFRIWLNDIRAEELVIAKITPERLENNRDINPLSRWVVLNYIREVFIFELFNFTFSCRFALNSGFLGNHSIPLFNYLIFLFQTLTLIKVISN